MLWAFNLLFLLDIQGTLERLCTFSASSNGDHSREKSIKDRIEAPINAHQSSADQIFIQEVKGG